MTSKDEKIDELERLIAQMLKPVRGVPFSVTIQSLCGHKVIPMTDEQDDVRLLADLENAMRDVAAMVAKSPIARPRPNEVGNDIEPFVARALSGLGLRVRQPTGRSGRHKAAGYPDLMIFDRNERPTYLECKTFNSENADTSFRAFYLSPSADFKITMDARHLLVAFEMAIIGRSGVNNLYIPKRCRIASLENLRCDVKYEFNASNAALYRETKMLLDFPL